MNRLEAQVIIENTGDYDEEEIDDVLDVYEEVVKHIGFKDERRDNRFVVKFHDICYYTPVETPEDANKFDALFEEFCEEQYMWIAEDAEENNIDIDEMLHPMCVGHYQVFVVNIPEITKENAVDIAMKVYDEFNYNGEEYVKNYIHLVNNLQAMEDNYMEEWIDFIEANEYYPEETIKQIKDTYHKDMERRK